MKNILNLANKSALLTFAAAVVFASAGANATIFYLKNGDRITGDIVGVEGENTILKTSMGVLKVKKMDIVSSAEGDVPPPEYVEQVAKAAGVVAPTPAPAPAADPYAGLPDWLRAYKMFWSTNVPEGWKFWLRGGMEYRKTSSESMAYRLSFAGEHLWDNDLNKFRFNAYYDYVTETSTAGVDSTTLDKYGIDTALRHDLTDTIRDPIRSGGNYTWFLENLLGYKKDMVKRIKHEIDEALTIGCEYSLPKDNFKISIAPGPAVRYIDAYDYDQHWVFMAVVNQECSWDFHELMRLEERLYMGINATNVNEKALTFMLGYIIHATDVMDIALRYYYEYDSINAKNSQTTEQRFMLSFELPFY